MEADPAGEANTKMAATIMKKPARWGLCWNPLESPAFSDCDVPVDVDAAGVAVVEAFVKMAASGELGDMPRSSVHWQGRYEVSNSLETCALATSATPQ